MAIGMTKLDAVNACLLAISEYRVTALDTGNTSIQADAERVLDESTRYFCSMGWPCNTRKSFPLTPLHATPGTLVAVDTSGSAGHLPATTLRIKSAGLSQHRTLTLRGDALYDANTGATTFPAGTVIFLDIAELLTFAQCEPILKEQISAYACVVFARRRVGSQLTDAFLSQEMSIADALNPRAGSFFDKPLFSSARGEK